MRLSQQSPSTLPHSASSVLTMWWQCAVVLLLVVSSSEGFVKMIATPVVYTNGNGGGADELEVTNGGNLRLLEAGNTVCAAWWVPYDNIPDLSAISQISTEPAGTQVKLYVKGVVRTGRVRIKIYAFVCG